MLYDFLTANRDELIGRCKAKMNRRASPTASSAAVQHGVPLFLKQLVDVLRYEEAHPARRTDGISDLGQTPGLAESSRTASLHGKALLDEGYTLDQVVHGYGDICQAITELAKEQDARVTVDEFHTLNRLLDNAIADAVSSYGLHRDLAETQGAQEIHARMGIVAEEQRGLLDTALRALDALKVGNIGVRGATATLLEDNLLKLRNVIDKSLPEIRLSSGMTTSQRSAAGDK